VSAAHISVPNRQFLALLALRIQKVPRSIRRRHHGLTVRECLDGRLQLDAATMAIISQSAGGVKNNLLDQWPGLLTNIQYDENFAMAVIFLQRFDELMTIEA
jgi:hypothetical protein